MDGHIVSGRRGPSKRKERKRSALPRVVSEQMTIKGKKAMMEVAVKGSVRTEK